MKVKPMGMPLMMLAGWINRHQQDVITCLKEENKILREKLGTGTLKIHASLVQGGTGLRAADRDFYSSGTNPVATSACAEIVFAR